MRRFNGYLQLVGQVIKSNYKSFSPVVGPLALPTNGPSDIALEQSLQSKLKVFVHSEQYFVLLRWPDWVFQASFACF